MEFDTATLTCLIKKPSGLVWEHVMIGSSDVCLLLIGEFLSFFQPSSAEDLRTSSIPSFSDESFSCSVIPKPSAEDEETLSTMRPPLSTGRTDF